MSSFSKMKIRMKVLVILIVAFGTAAMILRSLFSGPDIEIRHVDVPGPTALWNRADAGILSDLFHNYLSRSRFWAAEAEHGRTFSYTMKDSSQWMVPDRRLLIGRIVCSSGKNGTTQTKSPDNARLSMETIVRERQNNKEPRTETNVDVQIAPGVNVLVERAPSEKAARGFVDLAVGLGERLLADGFKSLLAEEGSVLMVKPSDSSVMARIEMSTDGQPLALSGWANFGHPERLILEWDDNRPVWLRRSLEVAVFGDKEPSLRYPFRFELGYVSPTGYPASVCVRLLSAQGVGRELGFSTNLTFVHPPDRRTWQ